MTDVIKILCVGDVIEKPGQEYLLRQLRRFQSSADVDFTVVQGENSAVSNGINEASADTVFRAGADIITGGNHTLKRREFFDRLESDDRLLRPANLGVQSAGSGFCIYTVKNIKIAVINLLGMAYMESCDNPFKCALEILDKIPSDVKIRLVDFHAEATSEKQAMGFMLDGRVSAVFGTHTHVQTSDIRILPKGTGYITDLGLCGATDSVIGSVPEFAIKKFLNYENVRFKAAEGKCEMDGALFTVSAKTGLCIKAEAVKI